MASHYDPVGDLDPRVGEHLLEVLAGHGIAAYLQPSTDLHPITRSTSLPARPTDRLFVDREHVGAARDLVQQLTADHAAPETAGAGQPDPTGDADRPDESSATGTDVPARGRRDPSRRPTGGRRRTDPQSTGPQPADSQPAQPKPAQPKPAQPKPAGSQPAGDGPDVDTVWAEIVAGYHLTADQAGPAQPATSATSAQPAAPPPAPKPKPKPDGITLGEPRLLPRIDPRAEPRWQDPHPDDDQRGPAWRRADPAEPSLLDALDTFGATLPDEDDETDEGYTPPPAPPLPRISAAAALGVCAIVGGLLLFVWPDLLPLAHDTVLVVAFGLVVAGFGTLIWRLRPGDDDDGDDIDDDGARV